jgi:hypothetical protein
MLNPSFHIADDTFHWIVDIGYLILYVLVFRMAMRLKLRRHRKWLIPYLIVATMELVNRTIYSIHLIIGNRWSPQEYVLWYTVWDIAHCIDVYATLVLCLVIVEWAKTVSSARRLTTSPNEPVGTAWPPPPRIKQD